MILLLDPLPPKVAWCELQNGHPSEPVIKRTGTAAADEVFQSVNVPDVVAYCLHDGGMEIRQPVVRLTPRIVAAVEKTVSLLPDYNHLTLRMIREGMSRAPDLSHWLICDSAFAASMPKEAAFYAVPAKLRALELARCGRYGTGHEWALRCVEKQAPGMRRLMTVNLAPQITATAFLDGAAVEISSGFTLAEGVVSLGSCGDIDPTIPLHLRASGMELAEINRALGEEGGLQTIAGRKLSLRELFDTHENDGGVERAREMLAYQLTKYAGAFAGVMNGLDAIAFFGGTVPAAEPFIQNLCNRLQPAFPALKVFRYGFNRWEAMALTAYKAFQGEVT